MGDTTSTSERAVAQSLARAIARLMMIGRYSLPKSRIPNDRRYLRDSANAVEASEAVFAFRVMIRHKADVWIDRARKSLMASFSMAGK